MFAANSTLTIIGDVLILLGAFLVFASAVGVVRFTDVLARMHALSKASTMGFILLVLGSMLLFSNWNAISFAALAAITQVLTSPVGSNLISRATYRASGIAHHVEATDELAEDLARGIIE